jgi:hypothetical protein
MIQISQSIVNTSVTLSLGAQWITLVIGILALYGRFPPLSKPDNEIKTYLLPQVLTLEMLVQIIELIFYSWYLGHLASDVTSYRYFDWFFTTPLMLISTAAFFSYVTGTSRGVIPSSDTIDNLQSDSEAFSNSENGIVKKEPDMPVRGRFISNLQEWLTDNFGSISLIVVANFIMLLLGYLQEIEVISLLYSTLFGFGAFVVVFYELYRTFVGVQPVNQIIYWIMFVLWGLYGFAAMLNPLAKNLSYNILDIFAKNFYGVFLAFVLYTTPTPV